jgi:hypothetical protein
LSCCLANGHAAIIGQVSHLAVEVAHLLSLWGGQVLESLHPIENSLPLLWRPAVEVAQPINELILPLRRKLPETGVIPQGPFLLGRRQILVSPQPFPTMWAGALGIATLAALLYIAVAPPSLVLCQSRACNAKQQACNR